MKGRIAIIAILAVALVAGAALYYLQVYAFYYRPTLEEAGGVMLTSAETGEAEEIAVENFEAIDADSSPIRYRACFDTDLDPASAAETYATYEEAEPLNAPGWFSCFDAEEVGEALERGEATAFLGEKDIQYGIDRIVAVFPDGRARTWHQINDCGAVVFDGEAAPEGCPPAPEEYR